AREDGIAEASRRSAAQQPSRDRNEREHRHREQEPEQVGMLEAHGHLRSKRDDASISRTSRTSAGQRNAPKSSPWTRPVSSISLRSSRSRISWKLRTRLRRSVAWKYSPPVDSAMLRSSSGLIGNSPRSHTGRP